LIQQKTFNSKKDDGKARKKAKILVTALGGGGIFPTSMNSELLAEKSG